jgi:hypothetical protein
MALVVVLLVVGYVAWWIDLLAHEAAHAIVARLLGHGVFEVRLGRGGPARVLRFGLLSIRLTPWPTNGRVMHLPAKRRVPRRQDFLISAAGPVASANLAVLGSLGLVAAMDMTGSIGGLVRFFLLVLACSSLFTVTFSLLPHASEESESAKSDGSRMLAALSRTRHDAIPALVFAELKRGARLFGCGETRRGSRLIARALRDDSLRQHVKRKMAVAWALAAAGCVDDARSICREILSDPGEARGSATRRDAADGLACLALYWNRRDLLEEGLAVITSAIEEFPDEITLRGTLGSILFELGDLERAEPLLSEVADCSEADIDRAITSVYLAVIHAARGEVEEANGYLETARFKGRKNPVVGRILDRLLPTVPGYIPPGIVVRAFSRAPYARILE